MFSKIVRRMAAMTALFVVAGCATGRAFGGAAREDWRDTLSKAQVAANDHRYGDADRLLADFAAKYPGSEGALESAYWRGVIALEPSNHDGSPQIATAFFETYSRGGGKLPHRVEADILRDIANRLQAGSPTVAVASPTPGASAAPATGAADLKAKDSEIQRLKDELAKANDELERIKRRLTAPTKP
ncbi:MAG TPA: hypothetical protein VJW73_07375 [Gemmatimonadaceae bacterium]|nr:hypothetical protein [Gemmatimonadaceae bacterium]